MVVLVQYTLYACRAGRACPGVLYLPHKVAENLGITV